jgi:hypothetical protein
MKIDERHGPLVSAKAGTQVRRRDDTAILLDSRLRGNERKRV